MPVPAIRRGGRARRTAVAASLTILAGAGVAAAVAYGVSGSESDSTALPAHHVGVPDVLAELGGDSFAGLRTEEGGQRIVSYWAGEIPSDVERYAASEPDGVTIELLPARFSRERLSVAAERVLDSRLVVEHAGITFVSLNSDGSGLDIAVEGAEPGEATTAAIAAVAGLPDDAIFYRPNNDPVVPVPATVAPPESGS